MFKILYVERFEAFDHAQRCCRIPGLICVQPQAPIANGLSHGPHCFNVAIRAHADFEVNDGVLFLHRLLRVGDEFVHRLALQEIEIANIRPDSASRRSQTGRLVTLPCKSSAAMSKPDAS